ncbi:MAG: hypothetical protein E5Y82_07820 [Mesorhizobium sp.]|nr:MAG: hypothetical protein E5Y82_07820 [Mesorhizobium sp.]
MSRYAAVAAARSGTASATWFRRPSIGTPKVRGVGQYGNRGVGEEIVCTSSPVFPYCPTALLPYCPTPLFVTA